MALESVTYETSDVALATVDAQGKVTARGTGSVTLTARSGGKSGTASLAVEGGAVHEGTIAEDEVWREQDNPHFVIGTVRVEGSSEPVLTIEPGVRVLLSDHTRLLVGQNDPGTLVAVGTAEKVIRFEADTQTPTPGFWGGIYFAAQTTTASELRYAELSYCGVANIDPRFHAPCVYIQGDGQGGGAQPVLTDVAISHSAGAGVTAVEQGAFGAGSARVSVTDGGSFAFSIDANRAGTLPEGGTIAGNTPNMINVRGDVVDHTQTWPDLAVPYVLTGGAMDIEGATSPVLTLLPGTELRIESEGVIHVGANAPGGLVAVGTGSAAGRLHRALRESGRGPLGGPRLPGRCPEQLAAGRGRRRVGRRRRPGHRAERQRDGRRRQGSLHHPHHVPLLQGLRRGGAVPFDNFATDFTAAEFENTFESTPGGAQCGPR